MTDKVKPPWQQLRQTLEETQNASDTTPLTDADTAFLAVVADEAVQNISIPNVYPTLYARLLTNRIWRTTFLSLLHDLASVDDKSASILTIDWQAIQKTAKIQPRVRRPNWETWEAVWRRSIDQLHDIFFTKPISPARGFPQITEHFNLLLTEFETGEEAYDVHLTAYWPKEDLEQLYVTLTLKPQKPVINPLIANLSWGPYQDEQPITPNTPQPFAPVAIQDVLYTPVGQDGDEIVAPLTLQLTSRPLE